MAARKNASTTAPKPDKGNPASKKPSTALAPRRQTTDLAAIDAEMAGAMAEIRGTIGQASGNRLKLEVVGDFVGPDGMNYGNEIQAVIVDYTSHNKLYTTPYDERNPTPPDCYAIGRVLADMRPEDDSPDKQNPDCSTCWANQWKSAPNGKAKACGNRRHVALIIVDPENPDAHNEPDAPIVMLDVAPTSLQSFDGVVSNIARSLNGPPVKAIVTLIGKNAGTYAKVTFTDPEPNPDYALHWSRRGEVQDMLTRKPDFAAYAAKANQPKGRGRGNAAPTRRAPAGRR